MTMQFSFRGNDTSNGIDRKKASAVALRIVKAAYAKALVKWDPSNEYTQEAFAYRVYTAVYQATFLKAIAKQMTLRINY